MEHRPLIGTALGGSTGRFEPHASEASPSPSSPVGRLILSLAGLGAAVGRRVVLSLPLSRPEKGGLTSGSGVDQSRDDGVEVGPDR
jgi:hypothetical protein